jgi:hypothetical protein
VTLFAWSLPCPDSVTIVERFSALTTAGPAAACHVTLSANVSVAVASARTRVAKKWRS